MSTKIPYYATDIPAPLPSQAEIDAASLISPEYGGRRIVKVGSHFVIKYGVGIDLIEGENMLFVQEHTNVVVPRVYALYSIGNKNYIVTEHITGQTLASVWPQLESTEKSYIITTLRKYFDELRSLQPPEYYGSLGQRSLLDGVFWTREPEPAINGPFTSEAAFTEALSLKYTYDGRNSYRADYYRQCLPRVFKGHPPTFTHGDFQRKNIMIQRCGNDSLSKDSQSIQIFLIDWEKSGWYPSFWEYAITVCTLRSDDDWCLWLEKALDPFVSEGAWLLAIRLELWS